MDTLEISLRPEQGIYTETYNPPQNVLGHFTFSVKKRMFSFVFQNFVSSVTSEDVCRSIRNVK